MKRKRTSAAMAIGVLALAAAVRAQAPASAPAFDATAFVTPYIDGNTLLVVHADMDMVDMKAVENMVADALNDANLPIGGQERTEAVAGLAEADTFLAAFKKAGGRHVFLLLNEEDLLPDIDGPAILLAVQPGADAKALMDLIDATIGKAPGAKLSILKDGVIALGTDGSLKRLQSIKPQARAELAFTQDGIALEAVAAVPPDQRRAIAELIPALPAQLGDGSTEWITRDLYNLRLMATLPPKTELTLQINTPLRAMQSHKLAPGEAVPGFVELPASDNVGTHVADLAKLFRESATFKEAMASPELAGLGPQFAAAVNKVLTPATGFEGATFTVDADQAREFLAAGMATLPQARMRAMNVQAMSDVRVIAQSCLVYGADHKDQLPESLDVLVKNGQIAASQLLDRRDPKHRPYVYQPVPNPDTDGALPLVWEPLDDPNVRIAVGFADAHSELLTREQLQQYLKVAQEHRAKAATQKAPAAGMP